MKVIGYAVTTVAFIIMNSMLGGYVLSKLWLWFVVSTFALPQISIATAIGLALMCGFLTKDHTEDPDLKGKSYGERLFTVTLMSLARSGTALLIGWIITLFV